MAERPRLVSIKLQAHQYAFAMMKAREEGVCLSAYLRKILIEEIKGKESNMSKTVLRRADCCFNCLHCFIWIEQDEDSQYYCTHNAPQRPKCGSNHMRESFAPMVRYSKQAEKKMLKEMTAWETWANKRRVLPDRVCVYYALRPDKKESS